jgi:hypothetical protein
MFIKNTKHSFNPGTVNNLHGIVLDEVTQPIDSNQYGLF